MCGETLSGGVSEERRNGPRRLRAHDDDGDDKSNLAKAASNPFPLAVGDLPPPRQIQCASAPKSLQRKQDLDPCSRCFHTKAD